MNLIAAVDKNWGIGKDNHLLVKIPQDQNFFREMTTGKIVIMGRKTLESFPNGRPLKNRTNIILTNDLNYQKDNIIIVHSINELLEKLKLYPTDGIYIIGGGKVYEQLLLECNVGDVAYITKIDHEYDDVDVYFPNLDMKPGWEIMEEGEERSYLDLRFHFCKYRKIHHNHRIYDGNLISNAIHSEKVQSLVGDSEFIGEQYHPNITKK